MFKLSNGTVLWQGPSRLDGKPIVCVLTGLTDRSRNEKTGNLLATWILRADMNPLAALDRLADRSVCGACPHRRGLGGSCYVNVGQAPQAVWKAWQSGTYTRFVPKVHLPRVGNRGLRLGSYGDPTALPLSAWMPLLRTVSGHVGYTHQWRTCDQRWSRYLMASVDTPDQREQAQRLGWRTFRIRSGEDPLLKGEFACPASAERGYRRTCETCKACDGATDSGRGASPAIIVHGSISGRFALETL